MHPQDDDNSDEPVPPNKVRAITEDDVQTGAPDQPLEAAQIYSQSREEEQLKAYAHLLDSAIRLPGGFRVGLDGIVGLVPGIGDLLGAILSGYLIYGASKLNIPRSVIARMILNSTIETIVGLIPLFGDMFDFIFKANERNVRLLHAALEARDSKDTFEA